MGDPDGVGTKARGVGVDELQALIVESRAASPRRAAQGIDTNRVSLLLAMLERRCDLRVLGSEAYVSVVGGVRVTEPGADLAVAVDDLVLGPGRLHDLGRVGLLAGLEEGHAAGADRHRDHHCHSQRS